MKKLLGISIVAMLAVTPMMANAAQTNATALAETSGTETNAIATTSYVKGAYNAVRTAHNAILGEITVTGTDHTHITEGNTVAENLVELDSAVAANDTKIGMINTLKNSDKFDTGEADDVVTAIITTKAQANATDSTIGDMSLTGFASGVDTVTKALQELKDSNNATNNKGIMVYNDWNSGAAPADSAFVGLSTNPNPGI